MKLFVKVWVFLLLLTAVEVYLAYLRAAPVVMLAVLLVISLMKAVYIIAYFMHMKYEGRLLRWSLFLPLVILILALLGILPDAARAQCIQCGRTAAAQNSERARVLNRGIVAMVVPPLLLSAGLLWRLRTRREVRRG